MAGKDQQRAQKAAFKAAEQESLEASMPLDKSDLADLFDHLDEELAAHCDHSLRLTRKFLRERKLDQVAVLAWLASHGGHCDCEVLANVEDVFEKLLRS